MSRRFALTSLAARDVDQILEYVMENSGRQRALYVLARLHEGFLKLAAQPWIGHVRNDLDDESLRVWPVFSYLVIYRPATKPLQIVRVIHGARDLPRVLDEE